MCSLIVKMLVIQKDIEESFSISTLSAGAVKCLCTNNGLEVHSVCHMTAALLYITKVQLSTPHLCLYHVVSPQPRWICHSFQLHNVIPHAQCGECTGLNT